MEWLHVSFPSLIILALWPATNNRTYTCRGHVLITTRRFQRLLRRFPFFFFFFPLFDRVESETRSQGYRDEKQKRENTWKLTLINFVGLAPINEGEPLDPSPRTDQYFPATFPLSTLTRRLPLFTLLRYVIYLHGRRRCAEEEDLWSFRVTEGRGVGEIYDVNYSNRG